MFGRLVDMATRTLIIDLSKGTGGEPMYGIVTVQRARATSEGTFEVLPWETKLKLFNGVATITEAVTDGSGPFYDSAYLIRVQNGYCAPRWGFMAALPDGTTPISTGDMPKVNPITGEGIYMDAQEWNALYGTLPDRVSAAETRLGVLDGLGQRGYTVDQSAGRVVKVWDYLNNREQLIYGYTGVRDISALVTGLSGQVLLSRDGNNVTLELNNVSPTGTGLTDFMYLPQGFRIGRTSYRWLQTTAGGMSRSFQLYASGNSRINAADTSDSYRQSFTFPTLDPWPTTLPGVAA